MMRVFEACTLVLSCYLVVSLYYAVVDELRGANWGAARGEMRRCLGVARCESRFLNSKISPLHVPSFRKTQTKHQVTQRMNLPGLRTYKVEHCKVLHAIAHPLSHLPGLRVKVDILKLVFRNPQLPTPFFLAT